MACGIMIKKTERELWKWDKAGLILNTGLAIVEMIGDGTAIARDNLVGHLELTRRELSNVIGNGANRDGAKLVRKGQYLTRQNSRVR